MHLTPTETDRLLLFLAAELGRARRDRGLLLNVPETIAIVADAAAEAARDGLTVLEAIEVGRTAVRPDQVLPGVSDIVTQVQVEAVFSDGSRLVTITSPVGTTGLGELAPGAIVATAATTGEAARQTRDVTSVEVTNEAEVPISVTSHFHFFETNPRLRFDRAAAYGRRLHVPSGEVVRFEPAEPRRVDLVPIAGDRVVIGFAGLVDGPLDATGAREAAVAKARACGFADSGPGPS